MGLNKGGSSILFKWLMKHHEETQKKYLKEVKENFKAHNEILRLKAIIKELKKNK